MPFLRLKRFGETPVGLQAVLFTSAGLRFRGTARLVPDLGHGNNSSKTESGREARRIATCVGRARNGHRVPKKDLRAVR
jgi:hypothetical protein